MELKGRGKGKHGKEEGEGGNSRERKEKKGGERRKGERGVDRKRSGDEQIRGWDAEFEMVKVRNELYGNWMDMQR